MYRRSALESPSVGEPLTLPVSAIGPDPRAAGREAPADALPAVVFACFPLPVDVLPPVPRAAPPPPVGAPLVLAAAVVSPVPACEPLPLLPPRELPPLEPLPPELPPCEPPEDPPTSAEPRIAWLPCPGPP